MNATPDTAHAPVDAARRKIVFHIGLERTGTTSFQRFCHDHRREFLARGLLYPTRSLAFSRENYNHAPLVASYLREAVGVDYGITKYWRAHDDVVASLQSEIARSSAAATLISAEHFSSRFYPAQVERLRRDFADYDATVVIVLRAHLPRTASAYSSYVSAGGRLTPDGFVDMALDPANWYIRYRETFERWARVFGEENVGIVLFEEGRDGIERLMDCGVIPRIAPSARLRPAINAQLDSSVLEALRMVNARISRDDETQANFLHFAVAAIARARVLLALRAHAPRSAAISDCMSPERLAALETVAAADRAWLVARLGEVAWPSAPAAGQGGACAGVKAAAEQMLASLGVEAKAWLWLAERMRDRARG